MKLSPLYEHLNSQFKAYCIPLQNVSIDEMMKAFTGWSAHTLKMLNKPVKEGYKMWALANHGYTWHFLWHSRSEGLLKIKFYSSNCTLIVI
jgi:Transposase IS4